MKKPIISPKCPAAIGPYSHGYRCDNLVITSGQLGIADGKLGATIQEQTHAALTNLKNTLEEGGSKLENVIKTTVFLADIADFAEVNKIYAEYFTSNYPARTCLQVAKIPMGALIEIEAIAYVDYLKIK